MKHYFNIGAFACVCLLLSSCTGRAPTQTAALTSTAPPTQVQTATTPDPDTSLQGTIPDVNVLDVLEVPEVFRGARSVREVSLTPELRDHLRKESFSAVTDGSGRIAVIKSNGPTATLCMVPVPEDAQDVQSVVPLSRYPASVTCLLAVDKETGEYSVLLVSDREGEANIEAEMPATIDGAELVWSKTHPSLIVDGEELGFELREDATLISSEGIYSGALDALEINTTLAGKVRIEGGVVEVNYPNISTEIDIGLHPSISERSGSDFLPVEDIYMDNTYWESEYGEGAAERQVFADVMYLFYRAWQHDGDDAFLEQRSNVSFLDYLDMVDSGDVDGGHQQTIRLRNDQLYPYNEQIRIYPLEPILIMIADYETDNVPYLGGSSVAFDFAWDPISSSFIVVTRSQVRSGETSFRRHKVYDAILGALTKMSYPGNYQWADPQMDEMSEELSSRLGRAKEEAGKIYQDVPFEVRGLTPIQAEIPDN